MSGTGPVPPQPVELPSIGELPLIAVAGLEALKKVICEKQEQCVINTLRQWDMSDQLTPAPVPTVPNETLRPAISAAYGVFGNNVSLPDLFGHGIITTVKLEDGDHLFYIGRLNPNWSQIQVAQGGFRKTRYLGSQFSRDLREEFNKALKTLNEWFQLSFITLGKIDAVEVGAVDLGNVKSVFPQGWINPARMGACSSPSNVLGALEDYLVGFLSEFLVSNRFMLIPLYTGKLLWDFRSINVSTWKLGKKHMFYSTDPERTFGPELAKISEEYPVAFGTISIKVDRFIKYTPVIAPANFIASYLKRKYVLPYSDFDILKVGIGAPMQSSLWCGSNGCSGYGNFALTVGVGEFNFAMGGLSDALSLGTQRGYVGVVIPDFSQLTLDQLQAYFKETLNMEKSIKLAIAFGFIISSIYEEYKKKYGDVFAEFVYQWVPITDNEAEAKQTAQELVEIAQKIYNRVREEINATKAYWALSYVEECLLEAANPYGDFDEQVKAVLDCVFEHRPAFGPAITE
mgnify:CR=1 FL=1